MEKTNKGFVDKIWDFFASVKLAIIIFAVLSITSIIGTIIEQNAEPERNIRLLTKFFGPAIAPTAFKIFDSLGFMDMYHSWWFITILLLFAANLIICSIDRLPKILRLAKEPVKPLSEDHFKGFGIKKEIVIKGKPEKVKITIEKAIKKVLGFNPLEIKEEKGYQLFSQKGSFTRLGVYITHLSILIILAGAIIGIFFGFKGFLNLPEGEISDVAFTRNGHERHLGFSIRCDDFNVDFYGNSDMPKEYSSILTVIDNGQEVIRKRIEVNVPLKYKGITFYQSSYGIVPGSGERSIFILRVTPSGGKQDEVRLRFGETFKIPNSDIEGKIEDFSPAIAFDQTTGRPFTYAEQMSNPAVYISFSEKGKPKYSGWILKRYPGTWNLPDGHTVEFVDLWGIQYTGLQVRRDPGVWIVYLGCIIMAIGLYIAFFMSHRRLWVRLIEEKNSTKIVVGATANKNRQAYERRIEKMLNYIKTQEGGH